MSLGELDHEALKKIIDLKWLGMKTISTIEDEDAVAKGENYMSIMKRLKITGTNCKGERASKKIVMKIGKSASDPVESALFKCEIKVYQELLPEFKKLSRELKFMTYVPWAICCGVRDYNAILLEDLVDAGYKMKNRRIPLTEAEATFIIENLAIFHGLSRAAINRGIIDSSSLPKNIFASNSPLINNLYGDVLHTLANCLEKESKWQSILPKIRAMAKGVGKMLADMGEHVKDTFPVINHGDCWTNNILFKYDENSDSPVALKFVDFQVTNYSCFAWDLTYTMHTSMSALTRQPCYKVILEKYRSTLIKTLENLHEDCEVPDLNSMLKIMDQLAPFALVLAFTMFPVTVCTTDKPWDFEKFYNEESPKNVTSPEIFNNEVFKESFALDVERFKKLGLL